MLSKRRLPLLLVATVVLVALMSLVGAGCSSSTTTTTAVPATTATTAAPATTATTMSTAAGGKDIVDTAAAAGNFQTLVTAVKAAGLVGTLKGTGPYTVFAPTDAAFAKLPKATLDALLADPQGELKQVLLYHVLPGKVMAADVKDGMEAKTVQGAPVKFSVKNGTVMINDATITTTDIETSNGVIHVIDTVLIPPK